MNKTTEKPSLECSIELVTPSHTRHMDVKITIEIDDPFDLAHRMPMLMLNDEVMMG